MSGYTPLTEIAAGIVDRIEATGQFKRVTFAQATNGEQVWEMLESLANLPCAVVAIGTADYEHEALKRTIRPLVFVVGGFKRGLANDAGGIWQLVEAVNGCFLPEITSAGADYPEICGIEFTPASWNPISSPASVSAYCLSLTGTEFLNKE